MSTKNKVIKFEDLGLSDNLLKGVYTMGFESLSSVQIRVLPELLKNTRRDTKIQAPSGCGKTATFGLALLHSLDTNIRNVQKLVMVPTRELALQIAKEFQRLGEYIEDFKVHTLIGGTQVRRDIRLLQTGDIQIIVGTPGRIYDMINRGAFNTSKVDVMVLDEADEMLHGNFMEQSREIMMKLPEGVNIYLCSATITPQTEEIGARFMKDPLSFVLENHEIVVKSIVQYVVELSAKDKDESIIDILQMITGNVVVFVNHKSKAEFLCQILQDRLSNLNIACIHGGMSPDLRKSVLDELYTGRLNVVIGTGLISRGIDARTIAYVINYDIPSGEKASEVYMHRVGRSGRFGRKGMVINFVSNSEDDHLIQSLKREYKMEMKDLPQNIGNDI